MDNSTWIQNIGQVFESSIGPLLGAIVGFIGALILEEFREKKKQKEGTQIIECCEKVNQKVFDKSSLGPATRIQIRAEESGPGSTLIDVNHIYVAVYRLRNLSNNTVERIITRMENQPKSIWFDIKQGETKFPDWDSLKEQILRELEGSSETDRLNIIIPYLNPYVSTKHEVFLELASYLPLDLIKIQGGGKGIGFKFHNTCEEGGSLRSMYRLLIVITLTFTIAPLAYTMVKSLDQLSTLAVILAIILLFFSPNIDMTWLKSPKNK